MHIDIAFNLIRHITSPSCDKFMKGLEKELSDLNLNPSEHKDSSFGASSPPPPTTGSSSSGPRKGHTGAGKEKDLRGSQFKDPVTPPRSFPCTPPLFKAPPLDREAGVFSSASGACGQKSGNTGMAPRHPPGAWHAHPAAPVAGDALGSTGGGPTPPDLHQERRHDEYKHVPFHGKTRDSTTEFMQGDKAASKDLCDRIEEAIADPVFQTIPFLQQGSELRGICESLREEFKDMLRKVDNEIEEGGQEIPITPSFSKEAAPHVRAGREEGADQQLQPGDRVLIYGLQSRKEFNSSHGMLLHVDEESQRWGLELLAFGINTGKQMAITSSNLRRIPPDAEPALPEADDADAHSHQSSDRSWSGDSWAADSRHFPEWKSVVKKLQRHFLPRAVRGRQLARRLDHVVAL